MVERYKQAIAQLPKFRVSFAHALRRSMKGYTGRQLRADVLAGVTVGLIALPLSMALAIASGVPPQHGLYTAIVAGSFAALLGGSPVNVTGPTAAFVVVLVPISAKFGLGGLLLATLLAGVLQILMGAARLGRLIQFIPYPVTTGFTAGIAVVIATLQIKDFFGLSVQANQEHFLERAAALIAGLRTTHWPDLLVGAVTLAVLIGWSKVTKRVPAPLVALTVGALLAALLPRFMHVDHPAATIGSRFPLTHGIPQQPPLAVLPWRMPGADGLPIGLSFDMLRAIGSSAVAIALLGAIESLLCAVVADGMIGTRHDPDAELVGQGVGNLVAPFFGGFAATGAIARTAANIRFGGRTPVAAFCHALFVLAAVVTLAPVLAYLPMASLAALLMVVAWNMSEARHFFHMLRVAPLGDVMVLLTCFILTVVFDMVVAVTAGVMLAALLFMRRMAETARGAIAAGAPLSESDARRPLPPGVVLYEIAGPLFFGAAEKAMSTLQRVHKARAVIFHLDDMPTMDMTGLVALETAINKLHQSGVFVAIAGVQPQPAELLHRGGFRHDPRRLIICSTLDRALLEIEDLNAAPPLAQGEDRGEG